MAEALKGIKINKLKNCLSSGKKHLDRRIVLNGEYFADD